jgi:hypothetical protein
MGSDATLARDVGNLRRDNGRSLSDPSSELFSLELLLSDDNTSEYRRFLRRRDDFPDLLLR